MIDLVYIVGSGSQWQNNELRFSLRSVEKNLTGYRNIFIIGHKPDFLALEKQVAPGLTGATCSKMLTHQPINSSTHQLFHIPAADISDNPDGNMVHKTLVACNDPRISNKFLYIHDDHFIVKPIKTSQIKNYHKGMLEATERAVNPFSVLYTTEYSERIRKTLKYLRKRDLPTYNFDGHYPMIFDKRKFIETFRYLDYLNNKYIVKSLYGNINKLPVEYLEDLKIEKPVSARKIMAKVQDRWVFSIGDRALKSDGIKDYLALTFPNPSSYEIPGYPLNF